MNISAKKAGLCTRCTVPVEMHACFLFLRSLSSQRRNVLQSGRHAL